MDEGQEAPESNGARAPGRLAFRLIVGLTQGLAIAFLLDAYDHKAPWALNDLTFAPAILLAAFWAPVLLVSPALRRGLLIGWGGVAAALIVGLAYYGVWREGDAHGSLNFAVIPALAAFLFIAHSLIASADADSRLIARYSAYFDTGWKLGIQGALSCGFVGLFWAVLNVGALLFQLIHLDFLRHLIDNRWFAFPASAVSFAYAVELTDVRVGLVRGLRNLALMLQSWLLPLMTLLAVAFLGALPFTGLEALWQTRSATALLLAAAAILIALINAAYRDGEGERPAVIRIAGMIGAWALVPIVGLASFALMLRIGQHGLTPDRIIALACVCTAIAYAIGYAISAFNIGGWLKALEPTNVFAAFIILAFIVALFTPLGDPARISVNDQVARLAAGKVAADKFDYDFLRFKAGRYGRAVLTQLAAHGVGADADKVASLAADALKRTAPKLPSEPAPPSPAELAAQITVYPKGAALPDSFLKQDWTKSNLFYLPQCLTSAAKCDALLVDIDGDGAPEILVFGAATYQRVALKLMADGAWQAVGRLAPECDQAQADLKAGVITLRDHPFKDVVIGGRQLSIVAPGCANTEPSLPAGATPPPP
jgi:hypothetical protein